MQRISIASKDIGFSVVFEPAAAAGAAPIVLFRPARVSGERAGVYEALGPGRLVLVFDNEHAWMYQKHIDYSVDVVSAEGAVSPRVERILEMMGSMLGEWGGWVALRNEMRLYDEENAAAARDRRPNQAYPQAVQRMAEGACAAIMRDCDVDSRHALMGLVLAARVCQHYQFVRHIYRCTEALQLLLKTAEGRLAILVRTPDRDTALRGSALVVAMRRGGGAEGGSFLQVHGAV